MKTPDRRHRSGRCSALRRARQGRRSRSSPPPRTSPSLAREVGGDKVKVESLASGYQDPHFVEAKPSFILKLHKADLLIVVGRELEIGWLPPLDPAEPQREDPARRRRATSTPRCSAKILEIPTGQITRAMGDVHPAGQPALLARSRATAGASPRRSRRSSSQLEPGRRRLLRAALRRLRQAPGRGREALGRADGALQGPEGRHLPPLVAELRRPLRPRRDRLRRAAARASRPRRATPST